MMPKKKSQAIWRCMWCHLVAKYLTNASGATWWPNFVLLQEVCTNARISNKFIRCHLLTKFSSYKVPPVMVSTHGSVVPLAMFKSICFTYKGETIFVFTKLVGLVFSCVRGWCETRYCCLQPFCVYCRQECDGGGESTPRWFPHTLLWQLRAPIQLICQLCKTW